MCNWGKIITFWGEDYDLLGGTLSVSERNIVYEHHVFIFASNFQATFSSYHLVNIPFGLPCNNYMFGWNLIFSSLHFSTSLTNPFPWSAGRVAEVS